MSHHCVRYNAGKNNLYRQYIKMCEKAKEIQESHIFREGDCFYHPKEGVLEVLKIRNERITATPEREVNCPISECTWLPTEEELRNIAEIISLTPESLGTFLEDTSGTYIYRPKPGIYFRMPEDQWLAYYMIEGYEKMWSIQDQKWKKIKL